MKIQRDNPGIKTPRLPRICIADLVLVLLAAIVLTSVLLATHLVPTAYILGMVFAYLGVAVVVFQTNAADMLRLRGKFQLLL